MPEMFAQQKRGAFSLVEARLEIPQRSFALDRLVDRLLLDIVGSQGGEERGIRAPRHSPVDLDLGIEEESERIGDV